MKNRWQRIVVALVFSTFALPCCEVGVDDEEGDGPDDDFLTDGKADYLDVEEGTAEACGVLRVANELDFEALDDQVRLYSNTASSILSYRHGPDGERGTGDDQHFDSLEELDGVLYVGPVAFSRLLDFSEQNGYRCETVELQILMITDLHGQLDSVSSRSGGSFGGAAVLSAHFQEARSTNPNTLILSGGDAYGASPPLASYFEEKPVVEAMGIMGVNADAIGNHGFDRGTAHLETMAELAGFPFLAANVTGVEASMACESLEGGLCIRPYETFWVGGVEVAVVGLLPPETQDMVKPGAMGEIEVTDPLDAAVAARDLGAAEGAQVFVAVTHLGIETVADDGKAVGPLVDLATAAEGFDVFLGGHTHQDYTGFVGESVVVETASGGQSYARITLRYDFRSRSVVERKAELVPAAAETVTPDQAVLDLLAPYRDELSEAFDAPIGISTDLLARGNNVERLGEVPIGNLVADSIRVRYGTDIAFVNGGGIRAPLPSSYQPKDYSLRRPAEGYAEGPPYDLVVGDAYAILPFGNLAVTRTVTGAQLWDMLEHSVEALPAPAGFFGQISGFRFTFDSSQAPGSRVTSVTCADGAPIPRDDTTYSMATSDFLDLGGDGYTMLIDGDGVLQDGMAAVLRDYIEELGAVEPKLEGRIVDEAAP